MQKIVIIVAFQHYSPIARLSVIRHTTMTQTTKTPKAIADVQSIINDTAKTYPEKVKLLRSLGFDKRPGKTEAEQLITAFAQKYDYYRAKKALIFAPQRKRDWKTNFLQYLRKIAPDVFPDTIFRKYEGVQKHACQIRQEIIGLQRPYTKAKAKKEAFTDATGLPSSYMGLERSILELQNTQKGYTMINGHIFTVKWDEVKDWEYYSKSWHNKYGPKVTIENRRVVVRKDGKIVGIVPIENFKGNYLVNAVITYLRLPKIKVDRKLKPIQISPYFSIRLLHSVGKAAIYVRELGGQTVDFCAVWQGETYHALTPKEAIEGVKTKISKHVALQEERLNYQYARNLGFCHQGITDFCELNSLDINATYTRQELRNVILKKRCENCARFGAELRKVNLGINCK